MRGKPVRLTPKEFELLRHLVANHGKAIPHRRLLQACGVRITAMKRNTCACSSISSERKLNRIHTIRNTYSPSRGWAIGLKAGKNRVRFQNRMRWDEEARMRAGARRCNGE